MSFKKNVFLRFFFSFLGGTVGKELACQCRRLKRWGSIPGLGRSPGGEHGNPLQYSCLENPMEEESGGLQSIKSVWDKEWDTTEVT